MSIVEFVVVFGITFVVGLYLGARIGWNLRENAAKKFVNQYLQTLAQEVKANTVMIDIERQGDMFLVYNKDTGEFLAQGHNHEEITKVLGQRFPSRTFTATPETLEKAGYKLNDTV